MKQCKKCGEVKELSAYHKKASSKDGRVAQCKQCIAAKSKEYYQSNKDKVDARNREYYSTNKEEIREKQSGYRAMNKDRIAKLDQQYKRRNRERLAEWHRNRRAARGDEYRAMRRIHEQNRRARIKEAPGFMPTNAWHLLTSAYGYQCMSCGSTDDLHLDHVIPLAVGGPHCLSNAQILCATCNTSKGARSCADYRPFVIEV